MIETACILLYLKVQNVFSFMLYHVNGIPDVICGNLYTVYNSSHTKLSSDIYRTETVFTCMHGLRLNDGKEQATVECMATGYWRDHDFYTDCAGQLIVKHSLPCVLLGVIMQQPRVICMHVSDPRFLSTCTMILLWQSSDFTCTTILLWQSSDFTCTTILLWQSSDFTCTTILLWQSSDFTCTMILP